MAVLAYLFSPNQFEECQMFQTLVFLQIELSLDQLSKREPSQGSLQTLDIVFLELWCCLNLQVKWRPTRSRGGVLVMEISQQNPCTKHLLIKELFVEEKIDMVVVKIVVQRHPK